MTAEQPSKPRLTYFDIRGRADPIRLILEECSVEYEDNRIPAARWAELKPTTPFGQLPLLEEGGRVIVQSQAICRHLARVHGLCGKNEEEMIRCDTAVEAVRDASTVLWSFLWRDAKPDREKFETTELAASLAGLERWFIAGESAGEFWAGKSFSLRTCSRFPFLTKCVPYSRILLVEFLT